MTVKRSSVVIGKVVGVGSDPYNSNATLATLDVPADQINKELNLEGNPWTWTALTMRAASGSWVNKKVKLEVTLTVYD